MLDESFKVLGEAAEGVIASLRCARSANLDSRHYVGWIARCETHLETVNEDKKQCFAHAGGWVLRYSIRMSACEDASSLTGQS